MLHRDALLYFLIMTELLPKRRLKRRFVGGDRLTENYFEGSENRVNAIWSPSPTREVLHSRSAWGRQQQRTVLLGLIMLKYLITF